MLLRVAACVEGDVSGKTVDREPRVRLMQQVRSEQPWWFDALLRRPADLRSLPLRVVVTIMIAGGAACTVASGVIHLYLWGKQYGYRDIPTIGPLFLIQGIVAVLMGLIVIVSRQVGVLLVAAGLLVASVIALVIAVEVGLFGFKDSWLAPYAWTTFYEEIAGGVLLLAAAGVLGYSGKAGR
jgi:hypothetical protein